MAAGIGLNHRKRREYAYRQRVAFTYLLLWIKLSCRESSARRAMPWLRFLLEPSGCRGQLFRTVRAVFLQAIGVKVECVFDYREAPVLGYLELAFLDFRIVEFLDAAALQADQVVVVLAIVELEHGLARFEMMAFKQASVFELGEHPIDGGQANIDMLGKQLAINIFGSEMARIRLAEQVEDGHARHGCLEAYVFEFCGVGHGAGDD